MKNPLQHPSSPQLFHSLPVLILLSSVYYHQETRHVNTALMLLQKTEFNIISMHIWFVYKLCSASLNSFSAAHLYKLVSSGVRCIGIVLNRLQTEMTFHSRALRILQLEITAMLGKTQINCIYFNWLHLHPEWECQESPRFAEGNDEC